MFSEKEYLDAYPDVAAAVARGEFRSGEDHYLRYGRAEGRSDRGGRVARLLAGLNVEGLGLEIGPSHNPVAPKRQGFNVHIVDHLDADGLRRKYSGHEQFGVHVENIEEVDFVSQGQPLSELVGNSACYDWIIASHVVEHIPDLCGFLVECEKLLKPGGRLSLAVPDMRYCFDHFGALTSTGMLLDAFGARRTRPTPGQVFDHLANSVKRKGAITWSAGSKGKASFELLHEYALAAQHWRHVSSSDAYVDAHCWRFVPESFCLVISDLRALGVCGLQVLECSETLGSEFFCQLGRGAEVPADEDRLTRLLAIKHALAAGLGEGV